MVILDIQRYNFVGYKDESTVSLYQQRLNSKLISLERVTFNEIQENIVTNLKEATQKAVGMQKSRVSKKQWWNEEVETLVQQEKQKYLKQLFTKSEQGHEDYKGNKKTAEKTN